MLQGRRLESRLLEAFANARAADPECVPVLWLTAAPGGMSSLIKPRKRKKE